MANVFDVAKYVIEREGKNGCMSTMRLQKLCYYCQAWSLVWDGVPLFPEDFKAWANGPMCRPLYKKTEGMFSVTPEDETGGEGNLTDNQIDSINIALDYYSGRDAQWLCSLSKMEAPWFEARQRALTGDNPFPIISKESMLAYYSTLEDS